MPHSRETPLVQATPPPRVSARLSSSPHPLAALSSKAPHLFNQLFLQSYWLLFWGHLVLGMRPVHAFPRILMVLGLTEPKLKKNTCNAKSMHFNQKEMVRVKTCLNCISYRNRLKKSSIHENKRIG